jgi:hypothetical protein
MIMQTPAGIAGDKAVQINLVTERQAQQVITLEVRLLIGSVNHPAATEGG